MNATAEIREILTAELEAHERLLDLKRREREELVRGSADGLLAVVGEIEDVVARIRKLEERRRAACRMVEGIPGVERAVASVAETLDRFHDESDGWSETCRARFSEVLRELQHMNRENGYLVRGSLHWVNDNLRILSGAGPARGTYNGSGETKTAGRDSVLVSRTA
jgi:flagellar biosynthesis/type III secretory pathway chaperone